MRARMLALAAFAAVATGCASAPERTTLYAQLGGELLYRATADRRIAFYFDGVDLDRLDRLLTEQICALADGPCTYSGETMAESHRGMGVDAAAFNRLVELLVDSMEAQAVPVPAQNRLLARLAPMQGDIVEAPAGD